MTSHSLTLAALATSAVSGLKVTAYSQILSQDDQTSILINTDRGLAKVTYAKSEAAESSLSKEMLCLNAFSPSARAMLSYEIPAVLGIVAFENTRAVVTTYPESQPLDGSSHIPELASHSISKAITEIHELPKQIVASEGLPYLDSASLRENTEHVLNKAVETGLVPEIINDRWRGILGQDALWDFNSVVTHGGLDHTKIFFKNDRVSAVLGWQNLKVADPALDFVWLAGHEAEGIIISDYLRSNSALDSSSFQKRLTFWQEFEIAKWLLHGVDLHNTDIQKDAVILFDQLVDYLKHPASIKEQEIKVDTPEEIIGRVPEMSSKFSETIEIESLEEDKFFNSDDDIFEDDTQDDNIQDNNAQTAETD